MILINDLHKQYSVQKKEIDKSIENSIKNSQFIGGSNLENFQIIFQKN